MKMFIRNYDCAGEFFDLKNQKMVFNYKSKFNGWYKNIGDKISAIIVYDYKVYLIWQEKHYAVNDDCMARVNQTESLNKKVFSLFNGTSLLLSFIYETEESLSYPAPFEYLDDDDIDWGMFLKNVINKIPRKNNFINFFMGDK
jgi:hypothetical protein